MRTETDIEDAAYSYTWCETDGRRYLRGEDGEFREVNQQALDLLRLFAEGELTRDALQRQIDGGEAVIDEASATTPEEVLDFLDDYLDDGIVREGGTVTRLVPPEDVRLWPRVLAFLVPLAAVLGVFVQNLDQLQQLTTDPPSLWVVAATVPAAFLFAAVHELGHYVTSEQHFDASMRVDTVNGIVPSFVTDTTGAWVLPPNRRVWINLAGPLVELLASLPLVWLVVRGVAEPLPMLLLSVIVSHVVFAVNPLIHGDGYWILCDLFDLVNVRSRGIDTLRQWQLSWPAVYVLASYGFGGLVVLGAIVTTVSVGGVRGIVYAAPLLLLFLLSRADVDVRPG
jgi:hypothetical protein